MTVMLHASLDKIEASPQGRVTRLQASLPFEIAPEKVEILESWR